MCVAVSVAVNKREWKSTSLLGLLVYGRIDANVKTRTTREGKDATYGLDARTH